MDALQAEHVRTLYLFVGDLNSTTTNRHAFAAVDFAIVSRCDQLVVGPTRIYISRGTQDLLMIDVPNLVRIAVVAPIGNSYHSSLTAVILMAQAVPNLRVSIEKYS